jgi:hypothetical protein
LRNLDLTISTIDKVFFKAVWGIDTMEHIVVFIYRYGKDNSSHFLMTRWHGYGIQCLKQFIISRLLKVRVLYQLAGLLRHGSIMFLLFFFEVIIRRLMFVLATTTLLLRFLFFDSELLLLLILNSGKR